VVANITCRCGSLQKTGINQQYVTDHSLPMSHHAGCDWILEFSVVSICQTHGISHLSLSVTQTLPIALDLVTGMGSVVQYLAWYNVKCKSRRECELRVKGLQHYSSSQLMLLFRTLYVWGACVTFVSSLTNPKE